VGSEYTWEVSGQWIKYTIPLFHFTSNGFDNQNLKHIDFGQLEFNGASVMDTFVVDDIYFEQP